MNLPSVTLAPLTRWLQEDVFAAVLLLAFWATATPLLAWLGAALLRRQSASARYCVWRLMFLGLLALPAVAVVVPGVPLGWLHNAPPSETARNSPRFDGEAAPLALNADKANHLKGRPKGNSHKSAIGDHASLPAAATSAAVEPVQLSPEGTIELQANNESNTTPWRGVIAMAWLLGLLANQIWFLRAAGWARRRLQSAIPVTDPRILRVYEQAARQTSRQPLHHLFKSATLLLSSATPIPLTDGVWRRRIVLPQQALNWTNERLRMVLLHELAHVHRRDVLWQIVVRVTAGLYWFHPLVWLAFGRMRTEQERACDDRVLLAGEKGPDYAAGLLEIAAALRVRPAPLAANVGMAQRADLENRLRCILDNARPRGDISPRYRQVLGAAGLCLLIVLGVFRPGADLPPSDAHARDPNRTAPAQTPTPSEKMSIRLPKKLVGQVREMVKGEDGKPISGARVVVELIDRGKTGGTTWMTYNERVIRTWKATTTIQGRYEIDAGSLPPQPLRRFFRARAEAKGYAEYKARYAWSVETVAEKKQLEPIQLPIGRIVRGRVLAPGGKPPKGILIQKAARFGSSQSWFPHPSAAQEDGRFQITTPKDCEGLVLLIVAAGWAPKRVEVPSDRTDLGDIVLKGGTPVGGRVLGRDGKPLQGVVVAMNQEHETDDKYMSFSVNFAAKTNAEGRFRLPPVVGKYKIWVAPGALTYDRLEQRYLISDSPPPQIAPKLISVDGGPMQQEVNFQAGPTLIVEGAIRLPDGKPAPKIDVTAGVIMEGTRGGIHLGHAVSDKGGRYRIELPRPIRDVHISVMGARSSKGEWLEAHPADTVRAHRKQAQFMTFKLLENDLKEADWELRAVRRGADLAPPQPMPKDRGGAAAVKTLHNEKEIPAHDGMARLVVWSPDGKAIASGSALNQSGGEEVALWDLRTGKPLWRFALGRGDSACSLAFSPDGRVLAVGVNGRILLLDGKTGELKHTFSGHGGACVFCCAFSPDGVLLATGGGRADNTVCVWDLSTLKRKHTLVGHRDEVLSVAFSKDGKTLLSAAGRADATVRIWDVQRGVLSRTITEFGGQWQQAFSPDSQFFAEARSDKVFVWNLRSGKLYRALATGVGDSPMVRRLIQTIAYSPGGKRIGAADGKGSVRIWNAQTGKRTHRGKASGPISSIAFSADGKRIVTGGRDGRITIWSLWSMP